MSGITIGGRSLQAQKFEGKLSVHAFKGGVKGFRFPGDRVSYAIKVQKPLTVSVVAAGKGFDGCAPISLVANGKTVETKSRTAGKIVFGPVSLPAGTVPLSFEVLTDARAGSAIGEILKVNLNVIK